MEIIIEEFKPLVEKLAREHYINVTIGEEDVRQELWRKLFEIAHTLSYSNDKEKDEVFRWVKTLFNNLIKDIKYSESRTHGSSQYCLMGDLTQLLSDEMGSIFEKISDHNQEDYLVTKELYGLIMKFAETQSASMKRFIYERLDTSKEIEDKWEERLKKSPRCKNSRSIPIWSMLNILGLNQREYYKLREDLLNYLGQHGFSVY